MSCPNCGKPEKVLYKHCPECDQIYSSKDLLELRQLEFLIKETEPWNVAKKLRKPYLDKLQKLRAKLVLPKAPAPEPAPKPAPAPAAQKPAA